jgi:purine-binding chemotaxis protein CheW
VIKKKKKRIKNLKNKNMSNNDLQQVISQVANKESEEEKKVEQTLQVLVFELDNEEYAVDITDLREIIRIPEITPIPNSPDFIGGILNLRGKIVVVVDLEKRFKLVRENEVESKHIIVTEVNDNDFGVIVDQVKEVLTVPRNNIQSTPDLVSSKIKADYLKGILVIDDNEKSEEDTDVDDKKTEEEKIKSRLVILLDLQKLLQEKELLQLGESIKKTADIPDNINK